MKIKITLIGFLTLIAGILPLVGNYVALPFPTTGYPYWGIIIGIGVVDLLYSFLASVDLIGFQHVVTGIIAFCTIFGGLLPIVNKLGLVPLPGWLSYLAGGIPHNAFIILIGIAGISYGISQLRY